MPHGRSGAKKGARIYSERKSDGDGEEYNSITKSEMQDIVKNAVDDALREALEKTYHSCGEEYKRSCINPEI